MRQNKMLVSPSGLLVLPALLLVLLVGMSTPSARSAEKIEGDHFATSDGDLVIHPINHATFVMSWKDRVIYVDPVGTGKRFDGLPKPDLILVRSEARRVGKQRRCRGRRRSTEKQT